MNWRRKAQLQKFLAGLPLSDALYFAVQRTAGSLRIHNVDPLEWFSAAIRITDWIEKEQGDIEDATFLEIGTGRMISLPIGLWLCGAGQTVTVDLNNYLSGALVQESCKFVRENKETVVQLFGNRADSPLFRERLSSLVAFNGTLTRLLDLIAVDYKPFADAASLPLPNASINYHVSYAVLEHIPADVVLRILLEARRLLAPSGLLIHTIDPSDHFSHDDKSITAINFLQFSEEEWNHLTGNKFNYHNRLRYPQYLSLLDQAGVQLLKEERKVDKESLELLKQGFPIDEYFSSHSFEELAITSVNLMGRFVADDFKGSEPALRHKTT